MSDAATSRGGRIRTFSGIQPTGSKHLGNLIGAIRLYVEGQERGEAIYCLVDLHAITVDHDAAGLRRQVHDTVSILLRARDRPAAIAPVPAERCSGARVPLLAAGERDLLR
jgi:hypothetical protein